MADLQNTARLCLACQTHRPSPDQTGRHAPQTQTQDQSTSPQTSIGSCNPRHEPIQSPRTPRLLLSILACGDAVAWGYSRHYGGPSSSSYFSNRGFCLKIPSSMAPVQAPHQFPELPSSLTSVLRGKSFTVDRSSGLSLLMAGLSKIRGNHASHSTKYYIVHSTSKAARAGARHRIWVCP